MSEKFYAYSDSGQEEIAASSIDEAAVLAGIPSAQEIESGAFLVVRDEEGGEERSWGTAAR